MRGLYDELRPGRPRPISDDRVAQLVRKTLKTKPKDGTHWSIRQIAVETGLSKSTSPQAYGDLARLQLTSNSRFVFPEALSKMILARRTSPAGREREFAKFSSCLRCSASKTNAVFGRPIAKASPLCTGDAYNPSNTNASYLWDRTLAFLCKNPVEMKR